nr:YhcH/YjgK/YiaL family protein [Staphylococcus delphini]
MIVAEREDLKRYSAVNPHFSKVVDFLQNTDLTTLELGRVEIDGDNVFANCMSYVADGVPGQQFENHQKYIDIHLVLENTEKLRSRRHNLQNRRQLMMRRMILRYLKVNNINWWR